MQPIFITARFPELSETFVLHQITGLMDLGMDPLVVASHPGDMANGRRSVELVRLRGRVHYHSLPKSRGRCIGRLLRVLVSGAGHWRALWDRLTAKGDPFHERLYAVLRLEPFFKHPRAVVICHFGTIARLHLLIRKILPEIRFCVVFHGYDVGQIYKEEAADYYDELFRVADLILPVSAHWQEVLIAHGCPQAKTRVHHMGIDVERLRPAPRQSSPTLRILSVGRLIEKKAHRDVLAALAILKERGHAFHYRIAGDGPLRQDLDEQSRALGLESEITFVGSVEHDAVRDLYQTSDVFVLPSVTAANGDMEGIPVVLMEAMAMELPVIATRHSGIPELVQDGETGLLVDERDVPGLANALERAITDRDAMTAMGRRARNKVEAEFNLRRQNQALAEMIKGL